MIIAVDGPAASGKGTLARRLAAHFGLAYLDTGTLYRATALRLSRAANAPDGAPDDAPDEAAAAAAAATLTPADLADPALRTRAVGEAAARVAAIPAVRAALLAFQRDFARHPPDGAPGAVLDGRDIGTVVCPEADVKLFVTASLDARAARRCRELNLSGDACDVAAIRADLAARDARDSGRADAPLCCAADAHLLDTTDLDIETAFAAALAVVGEGRR